MTSFCRGFPFWPLRLAQYIPEFSFSSITAKNGGGFCGAGKQIFLEAFEKLLELSGQFAGEGRDPLEEQRDVSLAHSKLGDVMNHAGRDREALGHLRMVLEIDKRMAAADQNDPLATRKLFIAYIILGCVYRSPAGQQLAAPEKRTSRSRLRPLSRTRWRRQIRTTIWR